MSLCNAIRYERIEEINSLVAEGVDLFEVSDDVSSDIKALIEDRKQEIIDGTFEIFEGSSDGDLLGMFYFVDNVVGTLD